MSRPSKSRRLVALSAITAIASACGRKADDRKEEPTPAPSFDAALPPTPGLVYFAVNREGVVELAGGVFRRVIATQGRIEDLAVAPNGDVYVVADTEIIRVAKGQGEEASTLVGDRLAPGLVRRIAAASDGALWAVGGKGLWHLVEGEWSADSSFPRPRTVVDVVATRSGQVIAGAADAAFIREADGWRIVPLPEPPAEPKPPEPPPGLGSADDHAGETDEDGVSEEGGAPKRTFLRSLALGADDRVYASTSSGVYLLEDAAWKRIAPAPVTALAVGVDGTIVGAAESGAIVWGLAGSLVEREISSLGLAAAEIDAIAADSLSRVWLASDGGLVLANREGEAGAAFSAGSIAALPGRVVAIRVIEAPTILPPVEERKIGVVAGKVAGAGAGVEIELCARPDTLFRGTPCGEAPYRGAATTDASGAFRVEGVPAGRYGFAIKKGPEWVVDLTVDCCTGLFSSAELTIDRIVVPGPVP